MKLTGAIALAALSTAVLSSPILSVAPEPTCTIPLLVQPSFETDCTFYEKTRTKTEYTDCGGCALETRMLGLGLPCRTVTTLPGVATTTVVACSTTEPRTFPGHKVTALPTITPS